MAKSKENILEVTPLCAKIKNLFTDNDIKCIHDTYKIGTKMVFKPKLNAKQQSVLFGNEYIPCAITDNKILQNGFINIQILSSNESKRQHIDNIQCAIPIERLKYKESAQICKSEHRNFGVKDSYYNKNIKV